MYNVICPGAGLAKSTDAKLRNALVFGIQDYIGELIFQELEGRLGSQTLWRPNVICNAVHIFNVWCVSYPKTEILGDKVKLGWRIYNDNLRSGAVLRVRIRQPSSNEPASYEEGSYQ